MQRVLTTKNPGAYCDLVSAPGEYAALMHENIKAILGGTADKVSPVFKNAHVMDRRVASQGLAIALDKILNEPSVYSGQHDKALDLVLGVYQDSYKYETLRPGVIDTPAIWPLAPRPDQMNVIAERRPDLGGMMADMRDRLAAFPKNNQHAPNASKPSLN